MHCRTDCNISCRSKSIAMVSPLPASLARHPSAKVRAVLLAPPSHLVDHATPLGIRVEPVLPGASNVKCALSVKPA